MESGLGGAIERGIREGIERGIGEAIERGIGAAVEIGARRSDRERARGSDRKRARKSKRRTWRDEHGRIPEENREKEKILTEAGSDINAQDKKGQTAIMWTCKKKEYLEQTRLLLSPRCLNYSLKTTADLTLQDIKGNTALVLAIRAGNFETVSLLIDTCEVDFNIRNHKNLSLVDEAFQTFDLRIISLIFSKALPTYSWSCKVGLEWIGYPFSISRSIEQSFNSKYSDTDDFVLGPASARGFVYKVDFKSMEQVNTNTGQRRQVRREARRIRSENEINYSDFCVPYVEVHGAQKWVLQDNNLLCGEEEREFNMAFGQFTRMLNHKGEKVPKSIEVWKSSALFQRFELKRAQFIKHNKCSVSSWVFHGTDERNIDAIMTQGFKVGGKDVKVANGTAHGKGVYCSTGSDIPLKYYFYIHFYRYICYYVFHLHTLLRINPLRKDTHVHTYVL
ncbi:hypothetical protein AAMO2058_000072900 [Amorphochlora amoebiformis]